MLQKLRLKFILTNMLLVSVVLLIVFGVLMGSTSQQLAAQSQGAMRMALNWSGDGPPRFEFGPRFPEQEPQAQEPPQREGREDRQFMIIPVFCVTVDAAGGVTLSQGGTNAEVSEALAAQAAEAALANGGDEGVLSKLDLRFLTEARPDGTVRIAFADRGWERANLNSLLFSSLLIGAGALLGFFLISLFLSRLSLRPVERAWEQQRQFVADASHELKTPLTVILANSGIILAHPEDTVSKQAKWIEYIQEEAKRMKGLVEDMLFLAKSDAAKAPPTRARVDMSELVTSCLLPFEPVAFENGVALESDIAPGLTAMGDEGQLRRLVLILLDNACKFAGRGGSVRVTLARTQDKLRLTVHNTGPAIPPEHLPHLFERFYRSDSARSREAGGYGLGLAIAKSITEAHRGRITVVSLPGSGTTFTVVLSASRAV